MYLCLHLYLYLLPEWAQVHLRFRLSFWGPRVASRRTTSHRIASQRVASHRVGNCFLLYCLLTALGKHSVSLLIYLEHSILSLSLPARLPAAEQLIGNDKWARNRRQHSLSQPPMQHLVIVSIPCKL